MTGSSLTDLILPALLIAFAVLALILAIALYRDYRRHKNNLEPNSWVGTGLIGFLSNFLDTLGIGSFATETAMFKFFRQCEDRIIPGTLNVANAIPTIAQAIIYTQIVEVEPLTLVLMLAAAVLGSKLGAGVVARLPEIRIQQTIGVALLITAGFLISKALNSPPDIKAFSVGDSAGTVGSMIGLGSGDSLMVESNGMFRIRQASGQSVGQIRITIQDGTVTRDSIVVISGIENVKSSVEGPVTTVTGNLLDPGSLSLTGTKLIIGVVANFILGALMSAGIGLYAPCMALVSMLGMSPNAAFPIMMGSCAMLMPISGLTFIREGAYNRRATFAIAITGVVGVLIAAFIVKELPMEYLRWLVVIVVLYTSVVMLRAALRSAKRKSS